MDKDYPELRKNNDFFLSNLNHFLDEHRGEFALIHDCGIIGFFPNLEDALKSGANRFDIGSFLVKQVVPKDEMPVFTSFRVTYA